MSHLSAEPPASGFPTEDVARFQEFFYRRTGIQFGQAKRYFLDRRLQERIEATGSPSLRAYLLALRFEDANGAEFQQLINAMTVNETYFYREEYQFRCLSRELMPTLVKLRPGERLRIWSLPCSTGEEAYSIALHLSENWPDLETTEVEITGSDIDTRVLAQASRSLLTLERAPGDVAAMNALFRAVHTLKGTSGLFDIPAVTRSLHAMEDLLGAAQAGRVFPAKGGNDGRNRASALHGNHPCHDGGLW